MADENQTSKSTLKQIIDEQRKKEKSQKKEELKKLWDDYVKAASVTNGIVDKMEQVLIDMGEDATILEAYRNE